MRNRKHDIERYLRGELTSAEMHALEREALNDPFLAEALEGVEQAGKDNFLFDLHKLNRSIHDRSRKRKARSLTMWGWPTGVAATLLLVAVSGYFVLSLLPGQDAKRQAIREHAPSANDTLNSADSLTVGSGPIAATQETQNETVVAGESAPKRADQSSAGFIKEQVPAEEKPVDEEIALQKELLAEQKARQDPASEEDVVSEALALEDQQGPQAKEEVDATPESGKKTDGLAGATDRRAGVNVPSRAPAASSAIVRDSVFITGKVLSSADGEAIPGVNVIVKGSSKGTVTDALGNYQLSIPSEKASLVFFFIGFQSKEIAVAGQRELNVELNEDVSSLSEVVIVSGYGSGNDARADETFRAAGPQTGGSDFKDYLKRSVKYPTQALENKTEGRVTVRFTVEPSGQLTGFEILRGIGSGCDEELIRAIREGPAWRPARQGERAVRDRVKVRYKFEMPR